MNEEISLTEVVERYKSDFKPETTSLISWCGSFHQDFIYRLLLESEERVLSSGDSKRVAKKIYGILYEQMNNIRFHASKISSKDENGFIMLVKSIDDYRVISGNYIESANTQNLQENIQSINEMEEKVLMSQYEQRMKNGLNAGRIGEGIGFLQLRKLADEPIEITFYTVDKKYSIFVASCAVKRKG